MTPQRESTDPIEVFFSYAHEDEAMLEELKKHLATLKNRGYISSWDDRQITAGQEWAGGINEHINSANVILLLVSADFLASTYCYEVEMRRAMERHEAREAQVIPVILRPCDWQGTPFDKLKALPKDGKPVTDWPTRDLAFLNIVQSLREAAGWSSSDVDVSSPVITGQATAGLRAIRPPVVDFVGRAEEIEQISKSLAQSDGARASGPICVVRGMGGMGKTQLAYKVAQQLESAFPDGQLLIKLRGEASNPLLPQQALQTIVTSIDRNAKPPDDPVAMEAMFQSTLEGKRVLIVADNAKGADQVRPLLPPKGSALLITTRQRFTLPGMVAIDLDTLPADAAEQLLRQICPRIGEAAGRLANLCGYLPLALRVSASVLASDDTIRIERYLDRLSNERKRLKVLHDPDDPAHDVEANLRLSYDALESAAQDAICQMGVFPASFDLKAAVAVIVPTGVADVQELLSLLHRRSLVDWVEEEQRYRLHDLVRAFAVAQLSDNEVARRHARYFAHLVTLVNQQAYGDTVEDGTDADDVDVFPDLWDEQANIEAGMEWARTHAGDDEADELLLSFVSTTDDFYDLPLNPETIEAALVLLRRRGDQEGEMSLFVRSADFYMIEDSTRAR